MAEEKLQEVVEPKKSTSKKTSSSTGTKKTTSSKTTATKKTTSTKSSTSTKKTSTTKTTATKKTVAKKEPVVEELKVEAPVEEVKVETSVEEVKTETPVVEEVAETVVASEEVAPIVENAEEVKEEIKVQSAEPRFDAEKQEKRQKIIGIVGKTVIYIFLVIFAIIVLFPFYFMILSSLKTETEFNASIPTLWITMSAPQFQNYVDAMAQSDLGRYMLNTVIVGVISTLLSLVLTILAAYAFARLQFKGRDALFALLLGTMMIPGELFTITNFATVYRLGWTNTYTVLIVPFLVSVFYVYLLRQNFKQIPDQLYYAAKVDGTSDFKYLWKVMIPLAAPSIVSITILKLMGAWNSYLWPQLVCTDPDMWLITNGLRGSSFTDPETQRVLYPLQMAACFIVSIPLFVVFIFFRKYIMKGVSKSGIKG